MTSSVLYKLGIDHTESQELWNILISRYFPEKQEAKTGRPLISQSEIRKALPKMTGIEQIRFACRLHNLAGKDNGGRADQICVQVARSRRLKKRSIHKYVSIF
jgi:hypothetical protein